jgi:uroporphyrinogen decarboxylase
MNSRERILTTLDHKEPDILPIGVGGHRSAGISAVAYAKLRDHLGLPKKDIRVFDILQMLAVIDDDVLEYLGADVVDLGSIFSKSEYIWHDWVLPDGTPCQIPIWIQPEPLEDGWGLRSESGKLIARMPEQSPYFDQIYFPLEDGRIPGSDLLEVMDECMWAAIKIPGPAASKMDTEQEKVSLVKSYREETDRAILGMFGSSLLERGTQLFRHENFYYMLAAEPEKAKKILGMVTEVYIERLETFLRTYGDFIDIIQFGDDLGMQTGPQISPQMFRDIFKPFHQKIWRKAKEFADVKVMLHSCGSILAFIPDLIDAGIDAINPVQISAKGMDSEKLKAEFGEKIVFWGGGSDTQQVLPGGTKEEIQKHVNEQIKTFSPGGGFVFAQVHNIQADVPAANIVSMMDEAKKFR